MTLYYKILIIALFAVAFCGCDPKEQQVNYTKQVNLDVSDGAHRLNKVEARENVVFDIPPSLVVKMQRAYNAARDKHLNITNAFDAEEMFGLSQCGISNAYEIVCRSRGAMKFCDDLLTDEVREEVWPFDVESFEIELETKMVRDGEGLYRLKPEFVDDAGGGLQEDGLVAVNPTIRWVNAQIEKWAINALDATSDRMSDEMFCRMAGEEKMPKDTWAWVLDDDEFFVIRRCDGAWNPREYMYVLWQEGKSPCVVTAFDSFPNRKEGVAISGWRGSPIAMNNVAVLEWQHRSQRLYMIPWRIKTWLENAASEGIETAAENLMVLLNHMPELAEDTVDKPNN